MNMNEHDNQEEIREEDLEINCPECLDEPLEVDPGNLGRVALNF